LKKTKDDLTDKLFEAILLLENTDECYRFFEDIGTINEIKGFAQRLEVAKLLDSGYKYSDVSDRTGASPATISRVSKCLNYGEDGYNLILDKLKNKGGIK